MDHPFTPHVAHIDAAEAITNNQIACNRVHLDFTELNTVCYYSICISIPHEN